MSCECPCALCDPCARDYGAGSTASAQGATASSPMRTPKPPKNTGVREQTPKRVSEVPLEQLAHTVAAPPPQKAQVVRMCVCVCGGVAVCRCLYSSCVCRTPDVNDAPTHVRRLLRRRVREAACELLRCRLPSPYSTSRMPRHPNRRQLHQTKTHRWERATKSANSPTLQRKAGTTMRARRTRMRAPLTSRRTQMHSKWITWLWRPCLSSCVAHRRLRGPRSGRGTQPRVAVEAPERGRLAKGGLKAKTKANLPLLRPRAPALAPA